MNEIHDLVDNINVKVALTWIPSHLGIIGNETVDQLAQSAATNDITSVATPFELKEINTIIQNFIIRKWQDLWQSSYTGKFYRKIEPSVSLRKPS